MPNVVYEAGGEEQRTVVEYLLDEVFPIGAYVMEAADYETQVESVLSYEAILEREGTDEYVPEENVPEENVPEESGSLLEVQTEENMETATTVPPVETAATFPSAIEKQIVYPREKLNDFDYLVQNFYNIDSTTTIDGNKLNAENMLAMNMSLTHGAESPQILIYHTHSLEGFADSVPGDSNTSIVAVGEYLAQILREQYGYNVIHDTGGYDVENRDNAYSVAGPALEQILTENPSIEVIIDLHRDGVAGTQKALTNINGNDTAKIMFFNGLSHTTAQGDIAYLANPNLEGNLAFSFRMQLMAAEYYPDFTKKIYLKGYRYNMHMLPKSTLIEVGNQNNTFQEAQNAMVPLADVINKVLSGE
ncbi:MAG: stage II sporulation protein P [Roseburia sp.]